MPCKCIITCGFIGEIKLLQRLISIASSLYTNVLDVPLVTLLSSFDKVTDKIKRASFMAHNALYLRYWAFRQNRLLRLHLRAGS